MYCYPIKLSAHVRNYAFGGRLIPNQLGKENLPAGTVAETWEVSDYEDTAGKVLNGPYAGLSLHELVVEFSEEMIGADWSGSHFPLLLKFLDASHALPVHLHADDETARRLHGEPHGKTEAWHIIWAAPGATVLAGTKEGLSREELREAFRERDYDAVMYRHSIRAGDTVYVPGGVLHSFGPDALVFEVQQTSDLGQFVTPEDLYGNPLDQETWQANIESTLDELRANYYPSPNPGLVLEDGNNRRILCCVGPYFALERWTLSEPYLLESGRPQRFLTLSNVGDPVKIEYSEGYERLSKGESCVLPAAIKDVRLLPEGNTILLACYIPRSIEDAIVPLREAGYSDQDIDTLGEVRL